MFQMPMSSPMMTTMFGFLPAWAAAADTFSLWALIAVSVALSTPLQQSSPPLGRGAGFVALTVWSAFTSESSRPLDAAHPPPAPTASAIRTGRFAFRNIVRLLNTRKETRFLRGEDRLPVV